MSRQTDGRNEDRRRWLLATVAVVVWISLTAAPVFGQTAAAPPVAGCCNDNRDDGSFHHMGDGPMGPRRPPMEQALHVGPRGRWWNDSGFVQQLKLTPDQQKRMEDVFEQNRPSLMELSGHVHDEEAKMAPLLAVDQPDESKVLAVIDRVAQARAELEKANARMLLGLRRVLTQDQWKKLQAGDPGRHQGWDHGPGHYPDQSPDHRPDMN